MRNLTLDYEFGVEAILKYAFISDIAVMLANWHGKSFSLSTDMTQTYVQRHMYRTPLTLKLKAPEKSHFRL